MDEEQLDIPLEPEEEEERENPPAYEARFDAERLGQQMKSIYNIMKDGRWRTLPELQEMLGAGVDTGISASLRAFRKPQYGSHKLFRNRRGDPKRGLWEYQLVVNE